MNYPAAIQDFFKSPKWTMSLLLGGICLIIPFAGAMVLTGWLIAGFWLREDQRFETFPEFTFNFFSRDLERGLWPVLANLILMVVVVPAIWICSLVILLGLGGFSNHGLGLIHYVAIFFISILSYLVMAMALVFYAPFYLRAARLQDFGAVFNFGYAKKFWSVMSKECLTAGVTLFASMVVMSFISMIPCVSCLALLVYPFIGVIWLFIYFHLVNQLYNLYVSRGGEAIPLSSKLTNPPAPPAPPASTPPAAPLPPA